MHLFVVYFVQKKQKQINKTGDKEKKEAGNNRRPFNSFYITS